ncbi:hypothetical protein HDU99_010122 [Rhizoclosmatium hyalinum]|nr:hypothetical protein HDU99_010122 [Rhizoclosmatium hyalinum]
MGGDGQKCDLGNGAVSPNDPIFWLHHGFVDKVWWRWQNRCEAFKRMYDGPVTAGDIVADPGQTLKANILQRVDTYGVTVLQMMDTQNGAPLCYTYTSSKSDLPMPAIQCPDVPPLPTATTAASSATDPNATADPTGTSSVAAATTTISSAVLDDIWLMNAFKALVKKAPAAAPAPPSFGVPGVPKFGNPNLSTSVAAGSGAIVFGRDENGTVADSNDAVATPAAVASIAVPSATETFNSTSGVNATSTVSSLPTLSVNSTVISNSTVETSTTLTVEGIIRPPLNHTIIAKEDNSTIVKYEKTNQTVVIPENETVLYVYPGYVESVDEEGNLVRHHLKVKPVEYKKIHGAPQNVTWNDPCYRMYQMPIPDAFIHHHQLNMQHVRNVEAINRMKVDEWNVKNCGPAKVTRSYTHIEKGSTSDVSSPPKSTFKPNPKNARTNALDRLGVEYMSGSTPYSWWWLSGLSGDSILPDSFGFIEPTFHERTQFNTEGKRPGFKRLVLAPIKKLIGVETGYDENEIGANALNPVGVVNMSPTSPKGANVTVPRRKSQVLVFEEPDSMDDVVSERIALSLSRKSSMKRPSLPVSPARAFSESVSYDGTDPEPVNASIQMETYSDSHRHPSKKVLWNAKTLDLGESKDSWQDSDLPDNLAREQQLIDIPGMSRVRQSIRSSVTILSREESSALSLNRAQDKSLDRHSRSSVSSFVSSKRRELEELDAAIAKCAAQSGSDNPFVKALMEQRARVADEMEPYIS